MKKLGVVAILCGVALLTYNLFNWELPHHLASSYYYSIDARIGLALGAVVFVSGILMYKRRRPMHLTQPPLCRSVAGCGRLSQNAVGVRRSISD